VHHKNSPGIQVDAKCQMKNMFQTKNMHKVFDAWIEKECHHKHECKMDMNAKKFVIGGKKLTFMELISDECYERIYNRKITSIELVTLVGC